MSAMCLLLDLIHATPFIRQLHTEFNKPAVLNGLRGTRIRRNTKTVITGALFWLGIFYPAVWKVRAIAVSGCYWRIVDSRSIPDVRGGDDFFSEEVVIRFHGGTLSSAGLESKALKIRGS
jgi:hypothetical protein